MKRIAQFALAAVCATTLLANTALAGIDEDIARLQHEWAQIKYQTPKDQQEKQFEQLTKEADQLVAQNPNRAEALIWHGIVEASYAGAKGGLGALSSVKSAKKSLEQALEIDSKALNGSAYTSLGSLYYQVPGWPIGFGDNKKALEYLKKGLEINPDGIDSNYFYGDYLFREGDLDGAERALRKALQAAPRKGREDADAGRRSEINQLLDKIAAKRKG